MLVLFYRICGITRYALLRMLRETECTILQKKSAKYRTVATELEISTKMDGIRNLNFPSSLPFNVTGIETLPFNVTGFTSASQPSYPPMDFFTSHHVDRVGSSQAM
jgi:hypothetical protein